MILKRFCTRLREATRIGFGILSGLLTPGEPVDPYATNEKYWRFFWLSESSDSGW